MCTDKGQLPSACQGVEVASHKLLSRCSRLAASATPQQQAAARATADDIAETVAALLRSKGLRQEQHAVEQAASASALSGLFDPGGLSAADAFNLSSRPGSRFKLVLDFDGNTLQNNVWNKAQGVDKIVTGSYNKDGDPTTFNAEEIAGEQHAAVQSPAMTIV
jgi:hypothetical protein